MGGAPTHPQNLQPQNPQFSSPHHRRRLNPFPVNSSVEVQTNEEDFKAVYFSATVVRSIPTPRKKYRKRNSKKKLCVEYQTLLAHDGDDSQRLREHVDVSFVRPAPPFQEIVTGFEPGDVVDAFHKDGWWTGVVKRVVEGGDRFVVTFQHPPDELEFRFDELRVHWDWIGGSWVRPENQSTAGMMFGVGRKVEVSSDRKDCQGVWFPATMQKDLGDGAFSVEYVSLEAEKKAKAVKVTTDHVRPCPPLLKDKIFVLLEKVDAFFDSGWWSGVITKVLENSRYIVFFRQMKRDMEFNQSELRPHMEWKDGKWFTSSQDVSIPASDDGMHEHHTLENSSGSALAVPLDSSCDGKGTCDGKTPTSLNSRKDQFEESTPVNQITSDVTASLTKRRQHSSESGHALSQPMKKLKEGNAFGACHEDTRDRSIKEILRGSPIPVSADGITSSAAQTAEGDLSSDNPPWGKRIPRQQRKVGATRNVGTKVNSTTKKSSTQTLQLETPELDDGGKQPDAVGKSAEDVQNKHAKIETAEVVIGLECQTMGSSAISISRCNTNKGRRSNCKEIIKLVSTPKQQKDSTIQEMKDSAQLESGQVVEEKKKRRPGRPRKIPIESIETPEKGNAENEAPGSADSSGKDGNPQRTPEVVVMGTEASLHNQENMAIIKDTPNKDQPDTKNRKGKKTKRTSAKIQDEKVVKESSGLLENRSSKRGRKKITDFSDASGGKTKDNSSPMEVEKVITEAPSNNEFDDEPLSKWIGGMQSPPNTDGSRPSPVSTVEESMEENGEKQLESEETQPSEQQQSLPFVKNTLLWKTIETMDVFKKIPQRPHFKPLLEFKESSREGLAIGHMVTFSSVVNKVPGLQFNDHPKSITDDIMETLAELETHGFDVGVVRDRVAKLLSLKENQGKLVDEVKELDEKILEHNVEKSRVEGEKHEIHEQIRKLQEKLSLLESAKEKEDGEIASLRTKVQRNEETIENMEREWEVIASSTWQ